MKDDLLYIIHMVENGRKVRQRTSGTTKEGFDADENLQLALAHLLQIIGEAARLVGPERREALPAIPWRQVTGMRHRIVHEYVRIDFEVVWRTANEDVPALLVILEPYLEAELRRRSGSQETL